MQMAITLNHSGSAVPPTAFLCAVSETQPTHGSLSRAIRAHRWFAGVRGDSAVVLDQEASHAGEFVSLFRDHRHGQFFPGQVSAGHSMLSPRSPRSRSTTGDCASARAVVIASSGSGSESSTELRRGAS